MLLDMSVLFQSDSPILLKSEFGNLTSSFQTFSVFFVYLLFFSFIIWLTVAGGGGHIYSMPELKTPLVSSEGQPFSLAI